MVFIHTAKFQSTLTRRSARRCWKYTYLPQVCRRVRRSLDNRGGAMYWILYQWTVASLSADGQAHPAAGLLGPRPLQFQTGACRGRHDKCSQHHSHLLVPTSIWWSCCLSGLDLCDGPPMDSDCCHDLAPGAFSCIAVSHCRAPPPTQFQTTLGDSQGSTSREQPRIRVSAPCSLHCLTCTPDRPNLGSSPSTALVLTPITRGHDQSLRKQDLRCPGREFTCSKTYFPGHSPMLEYRASKMTQTG